MIKEEVKTLLTKIDGVTNLDDAVGRLLESAAGGVDQEDVEWLYLLFLSCSKQLSTDVYLEFVSALMPMMNYTQMVNLALSAPREREAVLALAATLLVENQCSLVNLLIQMLNQPVPSSLRSLLEARVIELDWSRLNLLPTLTPLGSSALGMIRAGVSPKVVSDWMRDCIRSQGD